MDVVKSERVMSCVLVVLYRTVISIYFLKEVKHLNEKSGKMLMDRIHLYRCPP